MVKFFKKIVESEDIFLPVILLLAFFLRILWILHLDNTVNNWGDWWDGIAWNLASGKGYLTENTFLAGEGYFYSWRPPVFPVFLAGIYYLFGHSYLIAKIFMAILGSFSTVLCYFIGKKMFNKTTGILAALAVSIYPTFIFFNGYLAPETLTMFLILSFLFFLTRDSAKPHLSNYIIAGIFLGISVLCRTILGLFFVFILAWMLLNHKEKVLKKFILMVFFMAFVISPWIIRNYLIHRTFVFNSTDGGQALYINNNPESFKEDPSGVAYTYDVNEFRGMTEIEISRTLSRKAIDFIKNNPKIFLKYTWRRFINFWRPFPHTISGPGEAYSWKHQILSASYTIPLFVLAIIGFFYSLKNWRKLSLIYLLIIYYSGTYILVRAIIRYRVPIEPYLIIFASYGLWTLWQRIRHPSAENKNLLPDN